MRAFLAPEEPAMPHAAHKNAKYLFLVINNNFNINLIKTIYMSN
jgi:hypothetical protein